MAKLFSDLPLSALSQLLLFVILNLVPLLIWLAWDLDSAQAQLAVAPAGPGCNRQPSKNMSGIVKACP
jgi:hypothetical protein